MNHLVLIETKIKEGDAAYDASDKYAAKSVAMKVTAGKLYIEARDMCFASGFNWTEECQRVTSRSYSHVKKVMRIAQAPDPCAEEQRQREASTASQQKTRNARNGSDVGATPQPEDVDLGEVLQPDQAIEEWIAMFAVWPRKMKKQAYSTFLKLTATGDIM